MQPDRLCPDLEFRIRRLKTALEQIKKGLNSTGLDRARTGAFIVLACSQLFHSFNCRSMNLSLFKIGIFSNMNLIYAAGVSFLLQVAVVTIPFLGVILKVERLSLLEWVWIVALSTFPLWAMELVKFLKGRKEAQV